MSTSQRTGAPARTIDVPSDRIDTPPASLTIETSDGETASMALVVEGVTLALGEGFRVGEAGRWTWLDMPASEIVDTFGSFLSHAFESSDEDAREGWPTLTDEAEAWVDALTVYDEYPACETCGDPIDYCLGHGAPMPEVEQSARMMCVIEGQTYVWSGGEYIEVGYIATERGDYEIDYGHAIGAFVAQDCINVWDYETSAPRIPRTLDAFEARCCEFAREAGS